MGIQPRDWMALRANRFASSAGNATDGLRAAHDKHGAIGSEDVDDVARVSGLPLAAVAGTASFYADFTPVIPGQDIRRCDGTGCFVARGGVPVPAGDRYVYCVGCCYAAPAALHGANAMVGAGVPAPSIPFAADVRQPVVLAGLCGGERPWSAWTQALPSWRRAGIIAEVVRSGLRGRGGAEFPVGAKWRAANRNSTPRWVVANGDEGDPGSYCDRLLLEYDPHRVLEGLALCGCATGASHGLILVRSEYPAAAASVGAAIEQARAAGHLGRDIHGSGIDFDISVRAGAGSYVAGEETALLRALTGLRGAVQARPPYPTEYGLGGHPTVVQNIETLAAIPWIVRYGGEAYARLGRPVETGTKLVCLNASFERPGVYEVEFGTPLRHVVTELGGGLRGGARLRALQVGGPLGGFLGPDELDIGLATADLARLGVTLGHGSLVAVPDTVAPAELLRHLWTFAARESCGACAPCRVGTRRGLELVETTDPEAAEIDPGLARLLDIMRTGSMCSFGSGIAGAVRSLLRVYGTTASGRI
ncbi:NADH-quinone oxidoreductase subunit D [Nocardia sp. NBC_01503]|uniref:NADH-ubiquinone oxidoreductase-F iron-sulfur binding region domain-containing protein n=1 Tax=Nocardia sp. NBC_01503 TaxID=2975997 RepID=UPI002E7BC9F7|nr:NADH-ubiquinone oxidoreductase-F iron-sulfur binding region domain-containing protein [Nocardia sp. NBC_01503]WTL31065.1 NADH-quinone oxidoreductase subunit D [Nocardia sp. NBC_01503]